MQSTVNQTKGFMKNLILILLFIISVDYLAQSTSYSENKDFIVGVFDITFSEQSNPEISNKLIISAIEDYGVTLQLGPFGNLIPVLEEAFKAANCEECIQVSEKLTEYPINYIFDIIKYQDIFLITEYENQYKVIRYQPKEE